MSEKRRDNKGRILKNGESQRKDCRYLYKYIDKYGKVKSVYSWKLVPTDKVPAGKRNCLSLREKELEIRKDIDDGIDTIGKKMTLCQLYEKQNIGRCNVKKNTQTGRKNLMKILKNDKLGSKSIDSIKTSDAKEWAVRMKKNGYAYKTINNYKCSLKASFNIAILDDCIRKNPFNFSLNTIIKDDTTPKKALTEEQEKVLLSFTQNDIVYCKYYDVILLLLKTGLRISELCGLTLNDLDLNNRLITINHQLLRNKEIGYFIETPKTKSSVRQVPISEEAYQAFKRILSTRKKAKPIEIDGYKDFVFLNQQGYPVTGAYYSTTFSNLGKKFKKIHGDALPKITPHVLRHTFCTRLANRNMNPKSLQYIMGHSNINITLNLYTHVSIEYVKVEMTTLMS